MILKRCSVLAIIIAVGMYNLPTSGADAAVSEIAQLPELSRELINTTPLNGSSSVVAAENSNLGDLITGFPGALVSKNIVPSAISALATNMKHPYLLLAVGEGIAIAYCLFGQQIGVGQGMQTYLDSISQSNALSAVRGSVAVLSKAASNKAISGAYATYMKPLIIGGALTGFATAYFSPTMSDEQKAIAYTALVGACAPVLDDMYTALVGSKVAESLTPVQKINKAREDKRRLKATIDKKERVSNVAIALIALGGLVTTVQSYQEGTLSADMQLMASITLASAVTLARETVLYEYGYRATQKTITTGASFVTQVIAEPAKQYSQRLVDGVFNAFGWSRKQFISL